jgi:glycosyltransferase involved in cell wall biosynthesis
MRILEAVSTAHANGAVRYARRIIPELVARGHEVALAALPDSWISRELRGEVEILETGFERWPPGELRRVAGFVREGGFDLVHSHLTRANLFGALLHTVFGIRNVAHAHENKPHPHYWFHDRVLAVSADTLRRHRRYGAGLGKRGAVLPNFVDTQVFRPAVAGEPDRLRELTGVAAEVPVLIQVGDISPRKGQTVTLAALPRIWETHPEARMVFMGRGEPLGFKDDPRVHWLGVREDVPALLPHATVALLPSTVEPFGMAAIEAMACGVPLVASAVDGLREVIADGRALPVGVGSTGELAEAVLSLLGSGERRAELVERGHSGVRSRFGLDAHMEALMVHLEETLDRHR